MRRMISAAIAAATLGAGNALAGVPFDQFIAFGASYDDSGQFPDLELGGTTGLRFTNIDPATGLRGYSMPEWLALDLGLGRLDPSTPLLIMGPRTDTQNSGNLNFAVGGYRSEDVLASVVGDSVVTVGPFVERQPGFLARVASGALAVGPDTLYYALIAGNDIRDVDDPVQTAQVSAQIAQALVDAGARYIVLPTLPRLGEFAEGTNVTATGRTQLAADRSAAALAYNAAFERELLGIDGNFIRIDVQRMFDEVLADPVAFGFPADLDQSRVCYSANEAGGIACPEPSGRGKASGGDPDQFVFQDGLHPTQAAARAAADLMEAVIRAPGMIALLPEAALAEARAHLRTVEHHLEAARFDSAPGPDRFFVVGQGRALDVGDRWSTPGANGDAGGLTLGGSRWLGNGWSVGGAIGAQRGEWDMDASGSGFDTESLHASLFVAYRCDGWFAEAVLGYGRSDLDDIERRFALGEVLRRSESGDTDADALGLAVKLGVDMMGTDAALRFGPFLGMELARIEVDGYGEDGLSSSTMRFDGQQRDSALGSAGVFAAWPFGAGDVDLELRADVAYAREFEDRSETVRAVVKSLDSGPWFRMPGYAIDDDGWRAAVGVDATWPRGTRVGLSYRHTDNALEEQYLNLSASFAF